MYESYYGLTGKPFALSPDARFFYPSKSHKRAMSYLEYGVQSGEGFIVVTGEVGAGKTTLVQGLLSSLRTKPIITANIVSTQLEGVDLLQTVAGAFKVPYAGLSKTALLGNLERFLLEMSRTGKRALLVVDEVQNLGKSALEELRMLSNLQQDAKPLLQSFLVGQPEFREILKSADMLQLQQRVIAAYHLGPLDEADSRAYIEHRLAVTGWSGRPRFTNDAFAELFVQTGGVPRRINVFCDRLFLMGYLEELDEFGRDVVSLVADDMVAEFGSPQTGGAAAVLGGDSLGADDSAMRQLDVLDALDRLTTQGIRLERYVLAAYRSVRELAQRWDSDAHGGSASASPGDGLKDAPERGRPQSED